MHVLFWFAPLVLLVPILVAFRCWNFAPNFYLCWRFFREIPSAPSPRTGRWYQRDGSGPFVARLLHENFPATIQQFRGFRSALARWLVAFVFFFVSSGLVWLLISGEQLKDEFGSPRILDKKGKMSLVDHTAEFVGRRIQFETTRDSVVWLKPDLAQLSLGGERFFGVMEDPDRSLAITPVRDLTCMREISVDRVQLTVWVADWLDKIVLRGETVYLLSCSRPYYLQQTLIWSCILLVVSLIFWSFALRHVTTFLEISPGFLSGSESTRARAIVRLIDRTQDLTRLDLRVLVSSLQILHGQIQSQPPRFRSDSFIVTKNWLLTTTLDSIVYIGPEADLHQIQTDSADSFALRDEGVSFTQMEHLIGDSASDRDDVHRLWQVLHETQNDLSDLTQPYVRRRRWYADDDQNQFFEDAREFFYQQLLHQVERESEQRMQFSAQQRQCEIPKQRARQRRKERLEQLLETLSNEDVEPEECNICCIERRVFVVMMCTESVTHMVCYECLKRLDANVCPYCRREIQIDKLELSNGRQVKEEPISASTERLDDTD